MQHVIKTGSAAVADGAFIADPGDGRKIVIFGIHFAAAGDCKLTIEHGSTALHVNFVDDQNVNAGVGPIGDGIGDRLWEAPASTAVTYTTSAAVDQVVEAWYAVVAG